MQATSGSTRTAKSSGFRRSRGFPEESVLENPGGVWHQRTMHGEIDWEFVKEFHPLPNSDRRLLLKALGVSEISHLDDAQFYGWLAERYRLSDGQTVDAAIRRTLKKPGER